MNDEVAVPEQPEQPEQPERLERLELRSEDTAAGKRDELLRLFPEARTEDSQIDFAQLQRALGEMIDPGKERYGLTWPGKADCFKTIQAPSLGTLLPAKEESVNWDTTENLIIEGDNLEVLKLLQKAYLGKIKMIYIDPPYNTGNDFIYPDDYAESLKTYLEYTGQADEAGRRFSTNTDTDGRFHSKWLNMMYPRLYLARNLLRDDGVIFISINDVEQAPLRLLMNEVFGEGAFVAQFVWNNEGNIDNQSKIKTSHEYILCFARVPDGLPRPTVIDPNIEESSKLYNDRIENSITKNGPANPASTVVLPPGFPAAVDELELAPRADDWPKLHDKVVVRGGVLTEAVRAESGWSSRRLLDLFISNGCQPIRDADGRETWFAITSTGAIYGYKQRSAQQGHVLTVIRNVGTTKQNSNMLAAWGIDFPYPKPVRLIEYLCEIAAKDDPDAIVLDLFPGSGTTAHAVLNVNARQGGHRKFILVQLPEPTGRADHRTIADITKERVRRVIDDLNANDPAAASVQDRGFRVFNLAESNIAPWDGGLAHDEGALAEQLELHVDHVRDDRSAEDVLYEILLKSGFPLSTRVESIEIEGTAVTSVADGALLICLDQALSLELVRAVAAQKPERAVFLDEGFAGNDALKANAAQVFKAGGVTLRTV
jgi:adenine-specific DNA-methyltransferase